MATTNFHENVIAMADFFTWLLVVIGWVIVNAQNNNRENRKELRAIIDIISTELADLEKKAIDFHTAPTFSPADAALIRRMLSKTATKISSARIFNGTDHKLVIDFRMSITLHNFDKSNHQKLEYTDTIITEIIESHLAIISSMEEAFYSKHRRDIWTMT